MTSDTEPQRRLLGEAAVLVPPGDAERLADVLADLAARPRRVVELRRAAATHASAAFTPAAVTEPLDRVLVDGAKR
ncbi:glycosyltransferase [Georgenia sp. SUBG003]|uniref:glycosyltransferase n=1 Tax=Georgenia sp. SUBG003 TaxID=1497974 RepID=UPI0004DAC964|nr:hypothetical protein DA06_01460 [Georgenia sp. SUBG003]